MYNTCIPLGMYVCMSLLRLLVERSSFLASRSANADIENVSSVCLSFVLQVIKI